MRSKLTDKFVRELEPPTAGSKIYYDREFIGFGVRITCTGLRAFVLNYRANGVERRMTIGRFPTWPAIKARARAQELRREVDKGNDPMGKVEPPENPLPEDHPLPIKDILSLPKPTQTGIYFLFQDQKLQYVGQSNDVFKRVQTHTIQKKITFINWRFLPADLHDLSVLEEIYIRIHRPPYNVGFRGRKARNGADTTTGHPEGTIHNILI
jgi:hypothetical protein